MNGQTALQTSPISCRSGFLSEADGCDEASVPVPAAAAAAVVFAVVGGDGATSEGDDDGENQFLGIIEP